MSTAMRLQLDDVDWDAIVAAVSNRRGLGDTPTYVRADALSLSALLSTDLHEGLRCTAAARA